MIWAIAIFVYVAGIIVTATLLYYQGSAQCSGLQAGGEAPSGRSSETEATS